MQLGRFRKYLGVPAFFLFFSTAQSQTIQPGCYVVDSSHSHPTKIAVDRIHGEGRIPAPPAALAFLTNSAKLIIGTNLKKVEKAQSDCQGEKLKGEWSIFEVPTKEVPLVGIQGLKPAASVKELRFERDDRQKEIFLASLPEMRSGIHYRKASAGAKPALLDAQGNIECELKNCEFSRADSIVRIHYPNSTSERGSNIYFSTHSGKVHPLEDGYPQDWQSGPFLIRSGDTEILLLNYVSDNVLTHWDLIVKDETVGKCQSWPYDYCD